MLVPGKPWGRNLEAFNDILRGGFGTPEGGFLLVWKDSQTSRDRLGWDETIKYLERKLNSAHPANLSKIHQEIEQARMHEGGTLFDTIVEIVRQHGPGGDEASDGVTLSN